MISLIESEVYKPKILEDVHVDGILMNTALPGEKVDISQKAWITSYDSGFATICGSLVNIFVPENRQGVNQLLVLIRNEVAYVFEKFPQSLMISIWTDRDLKQGTVIFENQVVDISAVKFSDSHHELKYEVTDKLIYFFRRNFAFGLYYNLAKVDSLEIVEKELGNLHLLVEYQEVYKAFLNQGVSDRILESGWFPFISLIRMKKFDLVTEYFVGGEKNSACIISIRNFFNKETLERLVSRWWLIPALNQKRSILQSGIDFYISGTTLAESSEAQYIAALKILVTEIEGLLRIVFADLKTGQSIKSYLDALLRKAKAKFPSNFSLVFPDQFIGYLRKSIYQNFSPEDVTNGRHAIAHGAANSSFYTWEKTLQVILTIDQISFLV